MGHTFTNLDLHIVFGTKNRKPALEARLQADLHNYLATVVRAAGAIPHIVGGWRDHVHLLAGITTTIAIADLVRDVKSHSSRWLRETVGLRDFAWQTGYSAFTVSRSQRQRLFDYIATQADHHKVRSFREEYEQLLRQHGFSVDDGE